MANTMSVCVSISREFHDLAMEHHIKWSDAMRMGLSLIFAERGLRDYDNKLNLFRKMTLFRQQAEEALQKLTELEEKNANNNPL